MQKQESKYTIYWHKNVKIHNIQTEMLKYTKRRHQSIKIYTIQRHKNVRIHDIQTQTHQNILYKNTKTSVYTIYTHEHVRIYSIQTCTQLEQYTCIEITEMKLKYWNYYEQKSSLALVGKERRKWLICLCIRGWLWRRCKSYCIANLYYWRLSPWHTGRGVYLRRVESEGRVAWTLSG